MKKGEGEDGIWQRGFFPCSLPVMDQNHSAKELLTWESISRLPK